MGVDGLSAAQQERIRCALDFYPEHTHFRRGGKPA